MIHDTVEEIDTVNIISPKPISVTVTSITVSVTKFSKCQYCIYKVKYDKTSIT